MKTRRDTTTYPKATIVCFAVLVSAVVLYLYFLNMSVVQVVMRTEYTQQLRDTQANIALLEARYIESQHAIASRIATLEGYDTNTDKIFVSRSEASLVLRDE